MKNTLKEEEIKLLETNYQLGKKGEKLLNKVKLELACRTNNDHVGSGMGGNPSEFYFLLNHPNKVCVSDSHCYFTGLDTIIFHYAKGTTIETARQELTKFFNNHSDKIELSPENAANPDYLRALNPIGHDAKLLIGAMEIARELSTWLDLKIQLQKQIHSVLKKEQEALEKAFLREINLPVTFFEDKNKLDKLAAREGRYNTNLLVKDVYEMMESHPVWGTKYLHAADRYTKMQEQLLSQEDFNKLKTLSIFPSYILLFAFRSQIGIDRVVSLNLDELKEANFMEKIHKETSEKIDDNLEEIDAGSDI